MMMKTFVVGADIKVFVSSMAIRALQNAYFAYCWGQSRVCDGW